MFAIVWFRKSLRLHDNPALMEAIKLATDKKLIIIPLFCIDPFFVTSSNVGVLRWRFLLECLDDLDKGLKERNSRLYVFSSEPVKLFRSLFASKSVHSLFFESDTEPYAIKRDEDVKSLAVEYGVEVNSMIGHTLYDPQVIVGANGGTAPLQYRSFVKIIEGLPPINGCLDAPKTMTYLSDNDKIMAFVRQFREFTNDGKVPTMEQLGKPSDQKSIHLGGEREGLKRLKEFLSDKKKTLLFEKPKTSPAAFNPPSTTVLSPYLKFGALSVRKFYHDLNKVLAGAKHSQPPVSLLGQIYWREFYYVSSYATPNFHKIQGNPICLDIQWDNSQKAKDHLKAWESGMTGFPWIDAIMRQLRTEGWIHHLARHSVACFLTRGDLYVSWEEGVRVFDELLLDADYALNNGNWMWLSASCFFYQYFRIYSPISFGQKYDSNGNFIRKYVPELKMFPKEFIYEPWKAPISVQRKSECLIGSDYPKPIVDHDEARKKCLERMKAAYAQGLYGDGHRKAKGDNKDDQEDDEEDEPKTKKRQKKISSFVKKIKK